MTDEVLVTYFIVQDCISNKYCITHVKIQMVHDGVPPSPLQAIQHPAKLPNLSLLAPAASPFYWLSVWLSMSHCIEQI